MEKLLSISLIFLFLLGTEKAEHKTIFSGIAMTVPYRIIIPEQISPKEQCRIDQTIRDIFWRTHLVYNKFNPFSELSHINQLQKDQPYTSSPLLMQLLKRVDTYVKTSRGLFDPTVENKEAIDWSALHFSEDKIIKSRSETRLDLGGVAKGTTIDELLAAIQKLGYPSVLVEWGGDFAFSTTDQPWRIELFDPQNQGEVLELYSGGLATSGDYQQFWKEGEETHFHLYHPKEKRYLAHKSGNIMSVSVLAPTAEEADLFATTLLLLQTEDKANSFLSRINRPEIRAWMKLRP